MRKQLEFHDKRNGKLFDYYCEDNDWIKTYIFTVDWETKYKEKEALTDVEVQRFIAYYSL